MTVQEIPTYPVIYIGPNHISDGPVEAKLVIEGSTTTGGFRVAQDAGSDLLRLQWTKSTMVQFNEDERAIALNDKTLIQFDQLDAFAQFK